MGGPKQLTEPLVRRIKYLRHHWRLGAKSIAELLAEDGHVVSVWAIDSVLKQKTWNWVATPTGPTPSPPRPSAPPVRIEPIR